MRPADNIEKKIKNLKITTNQSTNESVLNDLYGRLDGSKNERLQAKGPSVWRIIMKSPITKAAAVILVVLGVFISLGRFGQSSVAFADVLEPIINAETASMDIIIGENREMVIHDEIMGSRIRRTIPNVTNQDIIIDLEKMELTNIEHDSKTVIIVKLDGLGQIGNYLDHLQQLSNKLKNDPNCILKENGLQMVDGKEQIEFVATFGDDVITIWADPDTELPTKIMHNTPNMQIVCDNMKFNIDIDESRFSTEIPEGYILQDAGGIDFQQGNEEAFIETLRIWAEIFEGGKFPDNIDIKDLAKLTPKIDESMKKAGLSEQEQMDTAVKWGQGLVFLRIFKGQG